MKDNHGFNEANAQMGSITQMVAALVVDYDRLNELKDKIEQLQEEIKESNERREYIENLTLVQEELAELQSAAGDCESEDEAEQRIFDDALSVEVRSGWASKGEELEPEEFRILICCGGPHVEIRGELGANGEPCNARLMYQDWGTRLTEYLGDNLDKDALITYSNRFFG